MRIAAVAVAVLLAACGPSADRRRFDAFRDVCNGLVPGGATLLGAAQEFDQAYYAVDCPSTPPPPLAVDQCNYTAPVCRVFFVSLAYDRSLCDPLTGGCYYWCEVRLPGSAPSDTAVVCGAWFVSGQPCPLHC